MNRYLVLAFLMALVATMFISCSRNQDDTSMAEQESETIPYKGDKEDLETLVDGNNAFALDLYAQLSKQKGNIVFSPYSISTALAMTYGGARGQTAQEMAKALHFNLPQQRLHPAFAYLTTDLQKEKKMKIPRYYLYAANALWGQEGFGFTGDFLQLTQKNYGAGFKKVNFDNAEEARQTINRWVAEQTKDKIKELLEHGKVNAQTRLILTNAIYFKSLCENGVRPLGIQGV